MSQPLSSWSPPATRWRHKRYIRNLHQWEGVAFAAAAGARVLVFIPRGAKYVRRVMPESWGALGRRDGIVRCPWRCLAPRAGQAVISPRKTIRAVIMRTIIDGTTDMRESPDWIVFLFQDGDDGFGQAAYRAFAEPIVLLVLNPRQQRDPCRARDVGLGISSKLRRHRAPHIMNSRCEAGATLRDAGQLERPEPCAKAEQSCFGGADDQKPRERCVWMTTKPAFPTLGAPMSPPWVHGSPASRVYLSLNRAVIRWMSVMPIEPKSERDARTKNPQYKVIAPSSRDRRPPQRRTPGYVYFYP